MKLMYGVASPFARKVRAAAIELGLDGQIELVAVETAPGRPNRAYAQETHPLRKVPALTLDDGTVLVDSTVICEYLDARAGGGRLVPHDGADRWPLLARHAVAQGMIEAAVLIRYETALRPADKQWPAWIDDQWDRIRTGLTWFEARADTLDGPVDLAQLALGCLLGYLDFRFADADWRRDCPRLESWFSDLSRRESFARTAPT